jgi:hypothetical protein
MYFQQLLIYFHFKQCVCVCVCVCVYSYPREDGGGGGFIPTVISRLNAYFWASKSFSSLRGAKTPLGNDQVVSDKVQKVSELFGYSGKSESI